MTKDEKQSFKEIRQARDIAIDAAHGWRLVGETKGKLLKEAIQIIAEDNSHKGIKFLQKLKKKGL